MEFNSKIDNERLSVKVQRALFHAMNDAYVKYNGKLPPEADLAKQLGVSRTVLRDVLANMESHGYISRKRGIGTIINKHILDMKVRIDIDKEILQMIEEMGFTGEMKVIGIDLKPCSPEVASMLSLTEEDQMYKVSKRYVVDGRCIAYSVDMFPKFLIKFPYSEDELQSSIFDFLETYCDVDVETSVTKIKPVFLKDTSFSFSTESTNEIFLEFTDTGYSATQQPILVSKQYFHGDFFEFSLLRRKLDL